MIPTKAIVPISAFGNISKYVLLKQCESYVEMCENFQKRSMRNRIEILNANGRFLLSIPLEKGKTRTAIKEVKISYTENWIKDHLEGIRSAYANAAYFEYYFDEIEAIYQAKPEKLVDFCQLSERFITKVINVEAPIPTRDFIRHYPAAIDLRTPILNHKISIPFYNQVFEEKYHFVEDLSILDLIMNLGPSSDVILKQSSITFNENRV